MVQATGLDGHFFDFFLSMMAVSLPRYASAGVTCLGSRGSDGCYRDRGTSRSVFPDHAAGNSSPIGFGFSAFDANVRSCPRSVDGVERPARDLFCTLPTTPLGRRRYRTSRYR